MADTNVKKNSDEVILKNTSPVEFKGAATTEFITSDEFSSLINSTIKGIFPDEYGCSIIPTPYGILDISIAFSHQDKLGDDAIQATYKIGSNKNNSENHIINSIKTMSMTSLNQKIYDLTDIAKKALSKYLMDSFIKDESGIYQATNKPNNMGGINWSGRMTHTINNGENIVVVRGFSADALAGLIHGTDVDGHHYQYNVYYVRPIGYVSNVNLPTQKFLIGISRADANEIAEIAGKTNNFIQPMTGSLPNLIRS